MPNIIKTERLTLRKLCLTDAPFILALLNTPTFKKFIGDRKIGTLQDAENYLINGPIRSYAENGFGLWLFCLQQTKVPIGICGLIKREGLQDVDIGFAMMPEFEGYGYAYEIASAVMKLGTTKFKLKRIIAITTENNERSIKLLKKLGLMFEQFIFLPNDTEKLMLFGNWKTAPSNIVH